MRENSVGRSGTKQVNNTTSEKLLVLGAGSFQLPLIKKAQEMGVYVIAITPDGDYPGIKVADKVYFHDATDEEYVLEVARKEDVDGVISDQGEIFVRAIAYAAEKMGLPGNGYETALLYTNKYKMRERALELGLPTIESKKVRTIEEALLEFRKLNGIAIIKPVDGWSSRGISKIPDEKELLSKFGEAMEYSGGGEVIIERFIEGPQFEVDSIAVGGHVVPLMYADLQEFKIPNVFSSMTRLYPSTADEKVISKLLDYNRKINEGFGMIQGMSHNEYILDTKTGEIYLIEAALRGGGTYIATEIAKMQTGLDTSEFLVEVALGKIEDVPEFTMNQTHCGYVCCYLPPGEIISLEGAKETEALDYVVKTNLNLLEVGQKTKSITDKNQRIAIVLHGDSRNAMLEHIEEIKNCLKIKVRTEAGEIKGPVWE